MGFSTTSKEKKPLQQQEDLKWSSEAQFNFTQMFVWRGPILIEPLSYTTRFTLEWSPSIRGPRKKPEPKSESEMVGQLVSRFLLSCFLRLQCGWSTKFLGFAWRGGLWRKKEEPKAAKACILTVGHWHSHTTWEAIISVLLASCRQH